MIMLTGRGVAYLRENWSVTVNKYGSKRKRHEMVKDNEKPDLAIMSTINLADVNRFNDRIQKLVNRLYTEPSKYDIYYNVSSFIHFFKV